MAVQTPSEQAPSIAPGTAIGSVQLTVPSLERSGLFYERLIGLQAVTQDDGSISFGPAGGPALLRLFGDPSAPSRDPRQTGLFHFAVLVPTRRDLAVALVRLAEARWRIDGASDHLVSEALYLSDPDGNGIEIYRDRERSQWPHDASGKLEMATLPLDIDDLLGELKLEPIDAEADALMPAGTRIGHMHLQVAELADIERFYAGMLGFDVTVRGYPGALFVSAGGYHHHIGLNTWNSRGGSAPAPGGAGLRAYEIRLGSEDALTAVIGRVAAAGVASETVAGEGIFVHDPSGNGILLTV